MDFFRQKYWNSLPFPNPGNLPDPGIQLASPVCPELAGKFFYHSTTSQILKSLTLLEIYMYSFPLCYVRSFSFFNSDSMFSLLISFLACVLHLLLVNRMMYQIFINLWIHFWTLFSDHQSIGKFSFM